jgi:hypothetical protein
VPKLAAWETKIPTFFFSLELKATIAILLQPISTLWPSVDLGEHHFSKSKVGQETEQACAIVLKGCALEDLRHWAVENTGPALPLPPSTVCCPPLHVVFMGTPVTLTGHRVVRQLGPGATLC